MTTRRLLDRHEVERIVKMPRSSLYEAIAQVRNPVNVNTRSGEREHGFRRT